MPCGNAAYRGVRESREIAKATHVDREKKNGTPLNDAPFIPPR
jgi:hypothetical protein